MFDNIVGNKKIKEMLSNTVKSGRTSHSYIFTGIEGIGKKLIAKEFSKMLLCTDENKYCSKCKSCMEFESGSHPDFIIIKPDADSKKKEIKIDQIRQMQEKIQEKPILSENKVYIIDEADKMNMAAQNCLLKTLEEPPKYATIILIATNENMFLSTIRSRCMIIHFEPIKNEEMKKFLLEKHNIDATEEMLYRFQGSISKALELQDKEKEYEKVEYLINNLNGINIIDLIKNAEFLYQSKEEIQKILDYMNIAVMRIAKQNYNYANCIPIIEDTKKRINQNCNYDMSIDNLLWKIWEEVN